MQSFYERCLAIEGACGRCAVGTSPVREALYRLAEGGLMPFIGQRDSRVPPLPLKDLEDLAAPRLPVKEAALRRRSSAARKVPADHRAHRDGCGA